MPCLLQNVSRQQKESSSLSARLLELESEQASLQQQLSEVEEACGQERSKVSQLEGELISVDMVKDGMSRRLEKVCTYMTGVWPPQVKWPLSYVELHPRCWLQSPSKGADLKCCGSGYHGYLKFLGRTGSCMCANSLGACTI